MVNLGTVDPIALLTLVYIPIAAISSNMVNPCKPNNKPAPKSLFLSVGFQPSPNGNCLWHWFETFLIG